MNIFTVLQVGYEVFHTRMLGWLFTAEADHGLGDHFLRAFLEAAGIEAPGDCQVDLEVTVRVPKAQRWRIADMIIRSDETIILVENKVDPGYQDAEQVVDEIAAGRVQAESESRRFEFVMVLPGDDDGEFAKAIRQLEGRAVTWRKLLERFRSMPLDGAPAFEADVIRQYLEFAEPIGQARHTVGGQLTADPGLLKDAGRALEELLLELPPDTTVTAVELWPQFNERYPDHAERLETRWTDSPNYSAKSWFASALFWHAKAGVVIRDLDEWVSAPKGWGWPRVRRYQRCDAAE